MEKQTGNSLQHERSNPNHTKGFQKVDEKQGHDEKYKKFNLLPPTTDKHIFRLKDQRNVEAYTYEIQDIIQPMSASIEIKKPTAQGKNHTQGRSIKRTAKNQRESIRRRKTNEIVAFFGEGVECKGKIVNHGNIRIDGHFEGEIHTKGSLLVGNKGMIEAKVRAGSVETEGTIIGDITAKTNVKLRSTATVEGELKTPELYMEDGAVLNTPWTLRMKNAKISGRYLDAKGLNVIESQGVDQSHLFTKK